MENGGGDDNLEETITQKRRLVNRRFSKVKYKTRGFTEKKVGLEIRLTDKIRPTSWDGLKIYKALSN